MQASSLKAALLSNAVFSAVSGLVMTIFGGAVANLIGLGVPLVYQGIGIGLIGFAGLVAWTGTRTPIDPRWVMWISMADGAWVAGTTLLIIVAVGALKPLGIVALLAVAGIVGGFAVWQMRGVRRV